MRPAGLCLMSRSEMHVSAHPCALLPDRSAPALAWELDDDPATYTLNKAVLDRVIASMEFTN